MEHLEARRPGEHVMSLEQISRLEEDAAFAAKREDDLAGIAKSITDVSQIFRELAVLVIDQGTVLDRCAPAQRTTHPCMHFLHCGLPRIDYNMDHVAELTQTATGLLERASISQVDTSPLKCAIALLICITFLSILLLRRAARE